MNGLPEGWLITPYPHHPIENRRSMAAVTTAPFRCFPDSSPLATAGAVSTPGLLLEYGMDKPSGRWACLTDPALQKRVKYGIPWME